MTALALLLLLLPAGPACAPLHGPRAAARQDARGPVQEGPVQQGPTREERLARWREALELDLAAEVVREGPALVTGRGALAGDPEATALVARALGAVGRHDTAHALLDGVSPEDGDGRALVDLARASLLLEEDRLNELIGLLAPAGPDSLRHPAVPEAWLLVGRAWSRGGEGVKADVFLGRFLELAPLHPGAPGAWYAMARHAVARRDGAAAAELRARAEAAGRWQGYLRARRLQKREAPREPLPRLGLAQLWMEVGRLEEARAELRELVALAPDFARGWSHLGEVERQAGRSDEARTALDRALELEPANPHALLARGRLLLEAERLDEARADLVRLAEGEHEDGARRREAWLWLARLERRAGRDGAAAEALARYRELGGTEEP